VGRRYYDGVVWVLEEMETPGQWQKGWALPRTGFGTGICRNPRPDTWARALLPPAWESLALVASGSWQDTTRRSYVQVDHAATSNFAVGS
jgi:hypothetical protein